MLHRNDHMRDTEHEDMEGGGERGGGTVAINGGGIVHG